MKNLIISFILFCSTHAIGFKPEYITTAKNAGWCEGFVIFSSIKVTNSEFQVNFSKTLNLENVSGVCILELTNYLNAYEELEIIESTQLPLLPQYKIFGNCELLYNLVDYQNKVEHQHGELFIAEVLSVLTDSYNIHPDDFVKLCES